MTAIILSRTRAARRLRWALLLGLACVWGSARTPTAPVLAQDATRTPEAPLAAKILLDRADYTFAKDLGFNLTATSEVPIAEAILRFAVGTAAVVNRRVATLEPGRAVTAQHTETLARGEIPPASQIRWWWELVGDNGQRLTTEPQSIRYLDQRFRWQSSEASRDVVVWSYDQSAADVAAIVEESRAALADLKQTFGRLPEQPIQIVAYKSQDDMRSGLVDRGGTYESRLSTLGARVAPDILLIDTGTVGQLGEARMRSKVLAHELSHIVLHLLFGHDYLDAPLWLDEGLAMVAEGPLSAKDQRELDQATERDELLSVRSMTTFPGNAALVSLAYAESHDVVSFLRRLAGPARFTDFLNALASGEKTTDEALMAVYGMDQLGLYQAYRASKKLPPAATPQPGEPSPARETGPRQPCSAPGLILLPFGMLLWQRGRRSRRVPTSG